MFTRIITAAFKCPNFILMLLASISIFTLSFALISQYGFGLYPCEFCLYQRIPYAVVIVLAFFGIMATKMMGPQYGAFNITLCGIALLINCGLAFYHLGIEQQWWISGCSTPDFSGMSMDEISTALNNAPNVRCDEIAWQLFGISMAGYNIIICLFLGVYSLIASHTVKKHQYEK